MKFVIQIHNLLALYICATVCAKRLGLIKMQVLSWLVIFERYHFRNIGSLIWVSASNIL